MERGFLSDIWAIGCLIYEMRFGTPVLQFAIQNPPHEAVSQIINVLGKLPPRFDIAQSNIEGYPEEYAPQIPMNPSRQIARIPLDVKVKDIEAERISLPAVNIEFKGRKPPIQAWKEKSFSSEYRAHIKNNPNIFWKPFPSARSANIDDSELTFRQYRIERTMNKNMSPLPKISGEEFVSLTNLLSKILRYGPEQRISLEDLAQHPWLTAPAEGKSQYVSGHWPSTLKKPRWSRAVKDKINEELGGMFSYTTLPMFK